ncbi:MAG: hypothetical protein AB1486_18225 [Planctomycetota bacterium]
MNTIRGNDGQNKTRRKVRIVVLATLAAVVIVLSCLLLLLELVAPSADDKGKRTASPVVSPGTERKEAVPIEPSTAAIRSELNEPRLVTGRVLDGAREVPLAGALALLSRQQDDLSQHARSREDGTFSMPLRMEEGSALLVVRCQGYREHLRELRIIGGESLAVGDIVLCPVWTIRGSVVDRQHIPIAGARVEAYRSELDFRYEQLLNRAVVWTDVTDREGTFCISPGGEDVTGPPTRVSASAAGHARREVRCSPEVPMVIELEQGRQVRGQLFWSLGGTPLSGAVVKCMAGAAYETWPQTKTDATGEFCFDDAADSDMVLGVFLRDWTNFRAQPDLSMMAPRGISDLGTIAVNGPASVEVLALDLDTGLGIAGATVIYGAENVGMGQLTTDESGRARIHPFPARVECYVGARVQGYLGIGSKYKDYAKASVLAGDPGSTTQGDLQFRRGESRPVEPRVAFGGIVTDNDGVPIKGVEIQALLTTGVKAYGGKTNERGRFHSSFPGTGTLTGITLRHPLFQPQWVPAEKLVGGSLENLVFKMDAGGRWLRGAVVMSEGTPAAAALVRATYELFRESAGPPAVERQRHEQVTDENGLFQLPYVPEARLECTATLDLWQGWGRWEPAELVPEDLGTLRVVLGDNRDLLLIRCVTEQGRLLGDVTIDLLSDRRRSPCCTVADGCAAIRGVKDPSPQVRLRTTHTERTMRLVTGPLENTVTYPAGQILEVILRTVARAGADEVRRMFQESSLQLELVSRDGEVRMLSRESSVGDVQFRPEWKKLSDEARSGPILMVRNFVPMGAFRVHLHGAGTREAWSDEFEVRDSETVLSRAVELELRR